MDRKRIDPTNRVIIQQTGDQRSTLSPLIPSPFFFLAQRQ